METRQPFWNPFTRGIDPTIKGNEVKELKNRKNSEKNLVLWEKNWFELGFFFFFLTKFMKLIYE